MNAKLLVALLLAAALVVFTVQNVAVVEVDFLLWRIELPRAVVLFGFLFSGILIGWIVRSFTGWRTKETRRPASARSDTTGDHPGPGRDEDRP